MALKNTAILCRWRIVYFPPHLNAPCLCRHLRWPPLHVVVLVGGDLRGGEVVLGGEVEGVEGASLHCPGGEAAGLGGMPRVLLRVRVVVAVLRRRD